MSTAPSPYEPDLEVLRLAVQQSASTVLITDREGLITYVNPRFTKLTGYTFEEVQGKTPRIISSGLTPPEIYEQLWNTITAGEEWRGELLNKRKDGCLYWGSLTISPIENADGETTHYLAIEEDITPRKLLEDQLQKKTEELSQSNEELKRMDSQRNEFLGMAVHDLRTPIHKIGMVCELLVDENVSDSKKSDIIKIVYRSAQEMQHLLSDILDMASIESGKITLQRERVPLQEYISHICEEHRLLAEQKDISLHCSLTTEATHWSFDPQRIKQVFANLLGNAFKFSERGTTVSLNIESSEEELIVSVLDEGPGIKEQELNQLFSSFVKTSNRPTEGEPSTGLGLAICQKIVRLHGGEISVANRPSGGSQFTFTLPMQVS